MRDRQLTVSYSHERPLRRRLPYSPSRKVPYLRLRGNWMREAGFGIGERVRVEVEDGRLLLVAEGR